MDSLQHSIFKNGVCFTWSWGTVGSLQNERIEAEGICFAEYSGENLIPFKFYNLHGAARNAALKNYAQKRIEIAIARFFAALSESGTVTGNDADMLRIIAKWQYGVNI